MKRIFLLTVLLSLPSLHAADPPSKRGRGFFGFGGQKTEQISAGLFPQRTDESPAAADAATSSRSQRDGIFRSGEPRQVDAVSYVIQNGRKIERPIAPSETATSDAPTDETGSAPILAVLGSPTDGGVETASDDGRKKRGFFAFGRRGDREEENEVVTPVPTAPPRATPAAAPAAAAPAAANIASATSGNAETLDTPDFAGEAEEKNGLLGWIPFFSRNKRDSAEEAQSPAPVIATARPVPAAPVAAAKPTPAAKPEPAAPKPAPAETTVVANEPASTTFEVPRNPEAKKEEKASSSGGGLLAPIANIRPPRKELDLTDAVTIIQDGEIVAESETNFETVPESDTDDSPQAPQIINGVKTYASWDDVAARSSSAADKIIRSMR
ncbi:MAG: hypothetical protein GXX91_15160 [Verrucomicrobiaceae bacterium]|nr:hypothetical protein [Verrucomicrobiaceae bacterium]